MAIKLSAWNLQEGLGVPGRSEALAEASLGQDADVVVFSDAYWLGNTSNGTTTDAVNQALERFRDEGYVDFQIEYGPGRKWEERYMVLLSRIAISATDTVELGCRRTVSLALGEPGGKDSLRLLGAHFNDETELMRVQQANDAAEHLADKGPSVIIGDLNALHAGDRLSKVLASSSFAEMTGYIPNRHIKSIGERIHQMAWGSAFRVLESHSFRDTDPRHTVSFPSRFPLLHLDRCFVSPEVGSRDFTVMLHNPSSDHRAIEVTVET